MTESQLTLLIRKYLSGESNEEEKIQIEQWYESFDASGIEFEGDKEKTDNSTERSLQAIRGKIEQIRAENVQEKYKLKPRRKVFRWWHAAAAAVLLLVFSEMTYLFFHKAEKQEIPVAVQSVIKDFEPGGNKAVLTLGNGQKILLDSTNNGLLSMQGGTKVIKLNNGQLAYNRQWAVGNGQAAIKNRENKVFYNTITTPRGGQYEIVLPDGSKVWLNAASSIRFPTAFTGKKREVEMTGEAYFEIAKNAGKPFIVKKGDMAVQVLGTHFNVMAYDNETAIKATLLEGVIKVISAEHTLLLRPGEQATVGQSGQIKLIKDANVNEAIAWKNNLFWFENDNVEEVMKQLSRWYNVDIIIQGNIPDLFTGSIPRNLAFSKVFEILQKTGSIKFKIINTKKIIITP